MKLNKKELKQFNKWLGHLYYSTHSKTKATLQDDRGFCCLGVGCDVLIPKKKKQLNLYKYLFGGMPKEQDYAPKWLRKINSDFANKTSIALTDLNDIGMVINNKQIDFNHEDIAIILDLVYNHKMLDYDK